MLYEHPAVAEAAVIGLPHDSLGEEIGAAVALKTGRNRGARRASRLRQGHESPPTSTRATSGSSTSLPKGPTGKIHAPRHHIPTIESAK